MKKKTSLIMTGMLIAGMATPSLLGGCANEKKVDTESFVEIQMYDRGYGTEGMRAVIEKYKEVRPDVTIKIDPVVDNTLLKDINVGPDLITTDMYFYGGDQPWDKILAEKCVIEGVSYDTFFEPLTEVYNYTPEGESRTIKEKLFPGYADYFNVNGYGKFTEDTYFSAPWQGGYTGLIYNESMFKKYGWEIPATTDELLSLSKQIVTTKGTSSNPNSNGQEIKIAAFSYSAYDAYWGNLIQTWVAQYDGKTVYENYFKGQDGNGEYTPNIAKSDGRYYTLTFLDDLLGTYRKTKTGDIVARAADEIYCDPTLTSRSYTLVQSQFLLGEKALINTNGATTSAMLPCGDWLVSEMSANFGEDLKNGNLSVKFMKTPVISDIIRHPDCCDTIENDAELSALIKAIDEGSNALKGEGYDVDRKAFDKVSAARHYIYVEPASNVYIPIYAKAKEEAKNFLKYLYSDEGLKIYSEATNGQEIAFDVDYDSFENIVDLQKSKFEIYKNAQFVFATRKNPIAYKGMLSYNMLYKQWYHYFNVSSKSDYIDPETIFTKNYQELSRLWDSILSNAGI